MKLCFESNESIWGGVEVWFLHRHWVQVQVRDQDHALAALFPEGLQYPFGLQSRSRRFGNERNPFRLHGVEELT